MSTRIEQLQKMLETEPHDSFLNYALALEHAKANDLQKAIQLIEKIIERDKNYLGAYYQLGKYYEQQQQLPDAVQTYKKGIEISILQKNRKAQLELNEALLQLEDE
ncbi:MAG TPA: tetratricopeptide repeat protein [Bacteroidia bacterium]|jgi:tetratricopeptide (TPR) repeat protein|nr:tetratricopeptide repeat protein [Bacteroidia bacterium]